MSIFQRTQHGSYNRSGVKLPITVESYLILICHHIERSTFRCTDILTLVQNVCTMLSNGHPPPSDVCSRYAVLDMNNEKYIFLFPCLIPIFLHHSWVGFWRMWSTLLCTSLINARARLNGLLDILKLYSIDYGHSSY